MPFFHKDFISIEDEKGKDKSETEDGREREEGCT
jgi:hypothetical protein